MRDMSQTERLFIAIPVRLYDYRAIQHTFESCLRGRWRDEETLHVTLAFLGSRLSADAVIAALEEFEWSFTPSALTGWDYFERSRVFVLTSDTPSLQPLYARLAPLLGLEDTLLAPHVTLMRVKGFSERESFLHRLQTPPSQALGMLEPKVILYRSRLSPQGAQYLPLKVWDV